MLPLPGQLALAFDATDVVRPWVIEGNERCTPAATCANEYLRGAFYRGYTPDTSEAEARVVFRQRYGYEPAIVARGLGCILLAGPLREAGR